MKGAGLRALLKGTDVAMVMLSLIFYQNKPQSEGSLLQVWLDRLIPFSLNGPVLV